LANTGAANDYSGDTSISVVDFGAVGVKTTVLRLGAGDQIPNGTGKGNLVFNGVDANHVTVLELNGFSETINGVSNAAAAGAIIRNTSAGASTLKIGDAGAISTFSGVITDGGEGKTLAITKIGGGKLTLSGANSYTGDTKVEAGTLSITSAYLADAADVFLTTGAVFELDFTAGSPDVIDGLFVDNVAKASGTWGSLTSTAVHRSSFFTGTGLLSVTTSSTLLGDADKNGVVDAADYIVVKQNFGMTTGATWEMGNFVGVDDDGTVDWDDLQVLMANFGTRSVGGAPAINTPEPATLGLLAIGALALLRRRRRS
jgi:autotransporter-associated beta strand protein